MNRLIFSEGGQPVFLEDLKMLQAIWLIWLCLYFQ